MTSVDFDNDNDTDVLICGSGYVAIFENFVVNQPGIEFAGLQGQFNHYELFNTTIDVCSKIIAFDVNRDSRMDVVVFSPTAILAYVSFCDESDCILRDLRFADARNVFRERFETAEDDFLGVEYFGGDIGDIDDDNDTVDFAISVKRFPSSSPLNGTYSLLVAYVNFNATEVPFNFTIDNVSVPYSSVHIVDVQSQSNVSLLGVSSENDIVSLFTRTEDTDANADADQGVSFLRIDIVDSFSSPLFASATDLQSSGTKSDAVIAGESGLTSYMNVDGSLVEASIALASSSSGGSFGLFGVGDLNRDGSESSYADVVAAMPVDQPTPDVATAWYLVWYRNVGGGKLLLLLLLLNCF